MAAKLTLRMDETLIESAKAYAGAHGYSVSQMVANYFSALGCSHAARTTSAQDKVKADPTDAGRSALGPITRSLVGLLQPQAGQHPVGLDDYHAYLEHKFLGASGGNPKGSEP